MTKIKNTLKKCNPFKGKISLIRGQKEITIFSYNLTPTEDVEIQNTLMCKFRNLNLSEEEKRLLSKQNREILYYFSRFAQESLPELKERFIKKVDNKLVSDSIITADGFGAYILLAAIYSGQLNIDKTISFEIKNSPVSLLPKKFFKRKNHNYYINFLIDGNNWLRPFSSLVKEKRDNKKVA